MRAYLDHAATTPLLAEAAEAMMPWLTGRFGNPSGSHQVARAARAAVDAARGQVADALGVAAGDVVFTSGGTEADNLAVTGPLLFREHLGLERGTIVTTAIEHHAVLHAAGAAGAPVRVAAATPAGTIDLDALADALDPGVSVVSVMLVNNELGTLQPLDEVAELVRRLAPGALLHTDAVQGMPWLDLRSAVACADLVSVSAHKFGGPQGVGALAVRPGAGLRPILWGGGQERERRAGTHNVAGIVGAGAAAEATDAGRKSYLDGVEARRDRLVAGILASVDGAEPTVPAAATAATRRSTGGTRRPVSAAPGFAHFCIDGVESEALLVLLDDAGVCASAGSACASGAIDASHVLLAIGVPEERALGSLRLTLGPATTDAEIDAALEAVPAAVARLRG